MFDYHNIKLLFSEVKEQHGKTFEEIKAICEKNAGPSASTVNKLLYTVKKNIFNTSYLKLKASLEQEFITDSSDNQILDTRKALQNFLFKADEDEKITITKRDMSNFLTDSCIRADLLSLENYLSYEEWYIARNINESLIEPLTMYDFSPPNQFTLRNLLYELGIPLMFDQMIYEELFIYSEKTKYSPFSVCINLYILKGVAEMESLWAAIFTVYDCIDDNLFVEVMTDLTKVLGEYARIKGFENLYISVPFYGGKENAELFKHRTDMKIEILEGQGFNKEKENFTSAKYEYMFSKGIK